MGKVVMPDSFEFKVLVIDPAGRGHLLLFNDGECWGTENLAVDVTPPIKRKVMTQKLVQAIADSPNDGTMVFPNIGMFLWEEAEDLTAQ